jgi:ribonuclease E
LWARLKKWFAGEPAKSTAAARDPALAAAAERHPNGERGTRTPDPRRDRGRGEHRRPPRHADGARRDHDSRDRNRDRDRDRDRKPRDRPPERGAEQTTARREEPGTGVAAATPAAMPANGEPASGEADRTEPRRGRRGRRRGRRGGGGSRSMGASDPANSNAPARDEARPPPDDGNGARPSEDAHAEPRESVAHFEPAAPAAAPGQPARPFVVWSSAPTDKSTGEDRGPQE